ncbi:MAG: biopolymer transporter ExbD [Myxococcota bacterium]
MAGTGPVESSSDDPDEGGNDGFTEINIVPLVDIMLVLLVILMATSTTILEQGQGQGSGFRVNLPTGAQTDELPSVEQNLVVAVLDDGSVVVRGNSVSPDELLALFESEAATDPARLVLVQADETALHKRVVEVMETARRAGLRNLAIATRPDEQ